MSRPSILKSHAPMSRSRILARRLLLVVGAMLGLTAQAPQPTFGPTPPATTSRDCPSPAKDTHHFLAAAAVAVRTPRGELSLVPVTQEATRERGLMCVVRIPSGKGMLFVFAPPDRVQGFWMKNTLVALDMVFVTAAGRVSSVAAQISPTPAGTTDTDVARRDGIGQFVIELGGGDAARHGIVRGTKLALPAFTAQP
jgi:uncharacterized membrane protein (UPF0127 family)